MSIHIYGSLYIGVWSVDMVEVLPPEIHEMENPQMRKQMVDWVHFLLQELLKFPRKLPC